MNYEIIRANAKQFTALTGYTPQQFDDLLDLFTPLIEDWLQKYTLEGKVRTQRYDPASISVLNASDMQLFFILSYIKNNPTQEYHAASFGLTQDWANRWIHLLIPVLNQALAKYAPARMPVPQSIEDERIVIDATERPVQRDAYVQEEYYSGKKKAHRKESCDNK